MTSSANRSHPSTRKRRQARVPLTTEEILELGRSLTDVFRMIRETRDRRRGAAHIKYPPLPPVFSESIVIAATPALFGPGWTAGFGGRVCDIILKSEKEDIEKRVEVKATGRHAFQELKEKDLRADFLVWIRFGCRFEIGSGPITAAVLEAPGKHIVEPRRLDVNRFEAIPGVADNQRLFHFDSLDDLLAGKLSGTENSPTK